MNQLAKTYEYSIEETLKQIKYWYNGYSWNGKTFVYYPYSVLLLLSNETFSNYWFGTGTPTFLLKLLKDKNNLQDMLEGALKAPTTFTSGQTLEHILLANASYNPHQSNLNELG